MITRLQKDLTIALRKGEALTVLVLRSLLSELNYKKIDVRRELTSEDVTSVIAKEVKKRNEAIESFTAGGRPEQAETERKEMDILAAYLPKMMTEKEIEQEIGKLSLPKDFGLAMKMASGMLRGKADMAIVSKLVKNICL